ncbi:MAG: TolC family protein [Planctomycetota bacterium]|jgi:outer membrane protein|nr:TolC family protein [Planctomycetota bacterium]
MTRSVLIALILACSAANGFGAEVDVRDRVGTAADQAAANAQRAVQALDASLEASGTPLVVTLESAAELARQNADAVLAAEAAAAALRAAGRAELSIIFPQLTADAGYTYNGKLPNRTLEGVRVSAGTEDEYRVGARIEQLVWSFGRIGAARSADRASSVLASSDLLLAQREASFRARSAVANVLLTQARLWVAQERVTQRESELADAQDKEAVGRVSKLDVNEAEINLLQDRNSQRSAALAVQQSTHELITALALENRSVTVSGELQRPQDMALLIAAARENIAFGPEVRSLQAQAELRASERAKFRGNALPEFSVFGDWYANGERTNDLDDGWGVGLNVRWNLYDGGGSYAQMDRAARERVRLLRLADEQSRARLQLFDDVAAQLRSLSERITAADTIVTLSESNYEDARDRYRLGDIDRVRMGEANLRITLARLTLIDLIFEEAVAAFQLQRLAE